MQIVPGSEISTPPNAARMDTTALRDAALAPGLVGAAMGDAVGGFFADVSQKIQENRNARMVFEADLAMRKTKDDFTAELVNMPDETTWLPAWEQKVNQLKDSVADNPHAGPDVRQMLNQKFAIWQEATTAETRTAALLKGVKESRESGIAAATYAANQGDIKGAMDTVKAMVENHAMDQGEADKFSARFPNIAAHAQADLLISTDPITAPEQIKKLESQMEPRMFVRVQATARAAQAAAQTQNLDQWAQQMDASPDGTIDPEALRADVANNNLTQRGMNSLMTRMDQTQKKNNVDEMSKLMMRADSADWLNIPDASQKVKELKEQGAVLPTAMRKDLYEHIDAKVRSAKKLGESDEKPVENSIFERMKEDRDKNHVTVPMGLSVKEEGWFTKGGASFVSFPGGIKGLQDADDKQVEKHFGKGVKKDEIIKAEEQHYADQLTKMRAWFKANPKATESDAETYRQSLERPYILSSVSESLLKKYPTAVNSASEAKNLPSGAFFILNGQLRRRQ